MLNILVWVKLEINNQLNLKLIEDQSQEISNQQSEMEKQSNQIESQNKTIINQKRSILLLGALGIIFIGAVIITFIALRLKKQMNQMVTRKKYGRY